MAKRMKIDPYYQQQKCSPMTLVWTHHTNPKLAITIALWESGRCQQHVILSVD